MAVYVGVDVGGTHIRLGTSRTIEKPALVDYHEFDLSGNYQADMIELTGEILRTCGGSPKAVGLGVAGMFDSEGVLTKSPNLTAWEGTNIGKLLEGPLGAPVVVGNDAYVAALGEATYHGGPMPHPFRYVTWGTGINARLVTYRGKQPLVSSGEFGHHIIDMKAKSVNCDGGSVPKCECTNAGCWETLCGGAGIRKRYRKPAEELTEREWNLVCRDFAVGLYNTVTDNTDVKKIVIGGGVMVKQAHRLAKIDHYLRKIIGLYPDTERKDELDATPKGMFQPPELKIVTSGERAGVIGGLALLNTNRRLRNKAQ